MLGVGYVFARLVYPTSASHSCTCNIHTLLHDPKLSPTIYAAPVTNTAPLPSVASLSYAESLPSTPRPSPVLTPYPEH